jgi:hypothetical protein
MRIQESNSESKAIGQKKSFKFFVLATLTLTSSLFANDWVRGKTIQTVEVGPGYVQLQSTESSNFNYYYKASDANNPSNSMDGMKTFLSLVLSAQASGSPVNLYVFNVGTPSQYISAASIGTMK